jgi:hypothetical protein
MTSEEIAHVTTTVTDIVAAHRRVAVRGSGEGRTWSGGATG